MVKLPETSFKVVIRQGNKKHEVRVATKKKIDLKYIDGLLEGFEDWALKQPK